MDRVAVLALESKERANRFGGREDVAYLLEGAGWEHRLQAVCSQSFGLSELGLLAVVCRVRDDIAFELGEVLADELLRRVDDEDDSVPVARLVVSLGWTAPWAIQRGRVEALVRGLRSLGVRDPTFHIRPEVVAVGALARMNQIPSSVSAGAREVADRADMLVGPRTYGFGTHRRLLGPAGRRYARRVLHGTVRSGGRGPIVQLLGGQRAVGWTLHEPSGPPLGALVAVCGDVTPAWQLALELANGTLTIHELADTVAVAAGGVESEDRNG
jgi:hypothetical protein